MKNYNFMTGINNQVDKLAMEENKFTENGPF